MHEYVADKCSEPNGSYESAYLLAHPVRNSSVIACPLPREGILAGDCDEIVVRQPDVVDATQADIAHREHYGIEVARDDLQRIQHEAVSERKYVPQGIRGTPWSLNTSSVFAKYLESNCRRLYSAY